MALWYSVATGEPPGLSESVRLGGSADTVSRREGQQIQLHGARLAVLEGTQLLELVPLASASAMLLEEEG